MYQAFKPNCSRDSRINFVLFVQIVPMPRPNNLDNLFRLFEYRYRDYPFQSLELFEQLEKTIWMIQNGHCLCLSRIRLSFYCFHIDLILNGELSTAKIVQISETSKLFAGNLLCDELDRITLMLHIVIRINELIVHYSFSWLTIINSGFLV